MVNKVVITVMKKSMSKPDARGAAVVCMCFLIASTGYLAWLYNIMNLVSPEAADALSLCTGYALQAAGIGLFALLLRKRPNASEGILRVLLPAFMLCMLPAALSSQFYAAMAFGLALNFLCGMLSGYYLYALTKVTSAANAGITLGIGYGLSIVASWLLSLAAKGVSYHYVAIIICLLLAIAIFVMSRRCSSSTGPADFADDYSGSSEVSSQSASFHVPGDMNLRSFCLLAGSLLLLFSVVNSCGFAFPSSEIKGGVSLETSRLFYAAGLMIAGAVSDRNRKTGAVCVLAALVIPFIMLTLKDETVPLMILWALGYFTFGFFTVYRIILFSDISRSTGLLYLSGLGLFFGRIGDATGEVLNLILPDQYPILIVLITAALFIISIFLFYRFQHLIHPATSPVRSEKEIFDMFSARHDLSSRERDVLRLILQEQSNIEIADTLSVSESTVKFHVHNILQKTGCRNRIALLALYSDSRNI